MKCTLTSILCCGFALTATLAFAQPLGDPDRGQPGDEMIQAYLAREAHRLDAQMDDDVRSFDAWKARREQLKQEYLYMLGLWPLPERTPLEVKVTGSLEGSGYKVDMLHFQSKPKLYVTANLYRPVDTKPNERLPAVLYVCGHSGMGRNGNKTAYQSHGIWFARHGYVCLMVDTLQLGEIAAKHHGTYNLGRWWWHSRGYTPAGVECWNGVRAIDYLVSRADVDAERIAVTGISGGGAATFWIAAADERVRVAVPVSGMADLESYVANRVINGHCDCMFLYNSAQWPWTRIAALVAPRPLLFVNSDNDSIFPMDANGRVIQRLERLYSLYGAGDRVDSVVSVGGHAYRQDLRQAIFRFLNTHLKNDPRPVTDSEIDLAVEEGSKKQYPIAPERLRVFPSDADLPKDELNTTIDEHFVPVASVAVPEAGKFDSWKQKLLAELRRAPFRCFPERIPAAKIEPAGKETATQVTEEGIRVRALGPYRRESRAGGRVMLFMQNSPGLSFEGKGYEDFYRKFVEAGDSVHLYHVRGESDGAWTRMNPPNYVERSCALLGRTVDTGRVWDIIASVRLMRATNAKQPAFVVGAGPGAVLAAYAALLEPEDIAGAMLYEPMLTHQHADAPQFLSVLRVCDVPDVLGMLAPRPLSIVTQRPEAFAKVREIYAAAGARDRLTITKAEAGQTK